MMSKRLAREDWQRRMREDWDARARENPLQSSVMKFDHDPWDPDVHFRQGRDQAILLMQPVVDRLGFRCVGKRILDVGCGIGRLFPGFAELGFSEIWGVDVSAEMIRQGGKLCPVAHGRFVLGNGRDLGGLDSGYFDYCFSYDVFVNIPDLGIVWRYLDEVHRVLRSGGVFQLHFLSHYSVKAKVAFRLPARLRPIAQISYRLATLGWLRGRSIRPRDVPGSLETRWGVPVAPRRVAHKLSELGFTDMEILSDPPCLGGKLGTRFWAVGRKP